LDSLADFGNKALRNLPGVAGKSLLRWRPSGDLAGTQRNRNRRERFF
jgi:hypothetical protein